MTSTLATSYTSTAAFVGGSFGGEGGDTNAHPTTSPQKSSLRSSSGAKLSGGLLPNACVRHPTGESVKSQQQCSQSYLRQYTYDVFPHPQQHPSSSNSSGDHPSAWSRSLYSETTRPYSSAGAHSSTSATSDEEEEVTHSTPRRPNNRLNRKLNLTFLPGDRSPPVQSEHHSPHNIQAGVATAAPSPSRPVSTQSQVVDSSSEETSIPHFDIQAEESKRDPSFRSPCKGLGRQGSGYQPPSHPNSHQHPQHQPVISSEPNLILYRSSILSDPSVFSPASAVESSATPFLASHRPQREMPSDVEHAAAIGKQYANPEEAPRSPPPTLVSHNVASFHRAASPPISRDEAAGRIARAWRAWKKGQELQLAILIEAIQQARHSAAVTIQRVWKGHQLRRFVHSEVCKLRILYWEPSMNHVSDKELEEKWTVKIFGAFTVPAWKSEVAMEYCRLRRMFVLYTTVPPGRYECKFIVNGKHTNCPWLHETISNSDGIENSQITIAAHPLKDWWGKRLAYLGKVRRGRSLVGRGSAAPSTRREVFAVPSSDNYSM